MDAYNVLHTTGVLPPGLAGIEVEGLARLIGGSRWRGGRVVLVCDGTGGGSARGGKRRVHGAEVVYAGAGKDADTLIETILSRESAPRRVTVVSSDQRLRVAARRRKAKWLSSGAFLERLVGDERRGSPVRFSKPGVPLEPGEVERWVGEFGIDPSAYPVEPERKPEPQNSSAKSKPDRKREASTPSPAPDHGSDPLIREALEEWRGRISLDDLDMRRWLGE